MFYPQVIRHLEARVSVLRVCSLRVLWMERQALLLCAGSAGQAAQNANHMKRRLAKWNSRGKDL